MTVTPTLEIPPETIPGLMNGTLVRKGGVIYHAAGKPSGGEVVCWMREAALQPQRPGDMMSAPMQSLMGFGAVASILNLGVTAAFGVATLHRLGKIDKKLEKIKWAVEQTYAISRHILDVVDEVRLLIEEDILAGLETAAGHANDAQTLEPGNPQRSQLFIMAKDRVTHSAARLRHKSVRRLKVATEQLLNRSNSGVKRNLGQGGELKSAIEALRSFRLTVGAVSLKSLIGADAGFLEQEISDLRTATEELASGLKSLGLAFFRPERSSAYDFFLNRYFGVECPDPQKRITVTRLARLASRVDPEVTGVDDLIQVLQEWPEGYTDYHALNQRGKDWQRWILPLPTAYFELEMAFEDVDRLEGHLAELEFCREQGLSIQEYRSDLQVNQLPDEGKLVFFRPMPDAA